MFHEKSPITIGSREIKREDFAHETACPNACVRERLNGKQRTGYSERVVLGRRRELQRRRRKSFLSVHHLVAPQSFESDCVSTRTHAFANTYACTRKSPIIDWESRERERESFHASVFTKHLRWRAIEWKTNKRWLLLGKRKNRDDDSFVFRAMPLERQ